MPYVNKKLAVIVLISGFLVVGASWPSTVRSPANRDTALPLLDGVAGDRSLAGPGEPNLGDSVGLPSALGRPREPGAGAAQSSTTTEHREVLDDPWAPRPEPPPPGIFMRSTPVVRGPFQSVQVNVGAAGVNIPGDAANEPSIAIDPTNPNRIVIGWRQFDSVTSNFRQAGWAYSSDHGQTWTFPGVLEPGEFSSDPVLDFDADGDFYYYSLQPERGPGSWACYLYKSMDGGVSWPHEVYAFGGDKAWMTIDRTGGIGHGNIYATWDYAGCCGDNWFTRSTDGGSTFMTPIIVAGFPYWGTLAVGPAGELYVAGDGFVVAKSSTMQYESQPPQWDFFTTVNLDGFLMAWAGPNPGGLLGQVWIAVDHSVSPNRGNVYMLCSVYRYSTGDPVDVMFARSTDGGATWSPPVRVNDDPQGNGAWQWFGTMSVAPNGRIDAIWNDTRNDPGGYDSELYYSYSDDSGLTWSANEAISPSFDPHVGWPNQNKLGDYYDMVSDRVGAHVAYAATFNGEQDVYYLRIGEHDCNDNGIGDLTDIANGTRAVHVIS